MFIVVTVLLDVTGIGLIMPVMPGLIMELTGKSVAGAATYGGVLLSLYALMQFLCAPTLGNISDRFGRRPVLLIALGGLAVDFDRTHADFAPQRQQPHRVTDRHGTAPR